MVLHNYCYYHITIIVQLYSRQVLMVMSTENNLTSYLSYRMTKNIGINSIIKSKSTFKTIKLTTKQGSHFKIGNQLAASAQTPSYFRSISCAILLRPMSEYQDCICPDWPMAAILFHIKRQYCSYSQLFVNHSNSYIQLWSSTVTTPYLGNQSYWETFQL